MERLAALPGLTSFPSVVKLYFLVKLFRPGMTAAAWQQMLAHRIVIRDASGNFRGLDEFPLGGAGR